MCTPVAFGVNHIERVLKMMWVQLGFKERKCAK